MAALFQGERQGLGEEPVVVAQDQAHDIPSISASDRSGGRQERLRAGRADGAAGRPRERTAGGAPDRSVHGAPGGDGVRAAGR